MYGCFNTGEVNVFVKPQTEIQLTKKGLMKFNLYIMRILYFFARVRRSKYVSKYIFKVFV